MRNFIIIFIGTISVCFLLTNSFVIPSTNNQKNHRIEKTELEQNNCESTYDAIDGNDDEIARSTTSSGRRLLLSTIATAAGSTILYPDEANAAFSLPFLSNEPRKTSLSIISNRANSTSATAIRQPTKEPQYDKELAAESCLLELLPTKNKAFRNLEKEILKVSILRDGSNGACCFAMFYSHMYPFP